MTNSGDTRHPLYKQVKVKMHCKEQRRIISEIYMFIFQSNPSYRDRITEKVGLPKKFNGTSKFQKVGSLDFLDLKVNGSPD